MPLTFDYRLIMILMLCCIVSQGPLRGDEGQAKCDALVRQLDSPRFHQRVSAAQELLLMGTKHSGIMNSEVATALRRGLRHPSLELRVAAQRLIQELEFHYQQRQLELLVNVRFPAGEIDLPGWQAFAEIVGDDRGSRQCFSRLVHRHGDSLHKCFDGYPDGLKATASLLDPWKLPSRNGLDWVLFLFIKIKQLENRKQACNWRLLSALSHSAMGPDPQTRPVIFKRLIEGWLAHQSDPAAIRDCLLVAMRYGCYSTAIELCERVWANQQASPATQVTALLVGNAIGASDLRSQAVKRMSDDRTAVVWQTLGSKPSRIRTQVADVARVILLHQHGVDPRSAGFHDLKADRRLIYRDHSLGFSDQANRERSWAISDKLIAERASNTGEEGYGTIPSVLHAN